MPPKAPEVVTEIFFDRAQAIKKMFEENEVRRNKAMETSKHVVVKIGRAHV